MSEAFVANFILMIFCYLKQYLPTDLAENLLATKKMQMKALYMILDTEMS